MMFSLLFILFTNIQFRFYSYFRKRKNLCEADVARKNRRINLPYCGPPRKGLTSAYTRNLIQLNAK